MRQAAEHSIHSVKVDVVNLAQVGHVGGGDEVGEDVVEGLQASTAPKFCSLWSFHSARYVQVV